MVTVTHAQLEPRPKKYLSPKQISELQTKLADGNGESMAAQFVDRERYKARCALAGYNEFLLQLDTPYEGQAKMFQASEVELAKLLEKIARVDQRIAPLVAEVLPVLESGVARGQSF